MNKNNWDVFLEKAKDNYEIAHESVNKKIYHTAISRFYYSIYQKMLYILYAESLYKSYDENRLHSEIYNDFIRYIQKKYSKVLSDYGRDSFRDIPKLKKLRKESDYSDDIINEKKYNTDFKDNYIEIEKYINIVIKKIKEKEKENE